MDKLNLEWLHGEPNFYFLYKRKLIESMIEGSCLNIGCGSHIIEGAVNVDEGLPYLSYDDNSFDTVVCSDVIEHLGPHRQAIENLLRVARKKVIITVPAYKWLYGKYDKLLGHKRRYRANDFTGFETSYLFWFLVPILFLRKVLCLKHRPLPGIVNDIFFKLSHRHFGFGTTILAVKHKVSHETEKQHKISIFIPVFNEADVIMRYINTLDRILEKIPSHYDIFIVNDASQDKTELISRKIEQANRKVVLLNYDIGPTRRENLAQAFKKATGDIIAFIDVDLVVSLRFVRDLIDQVILGHDIVTGSRYIYGSRIKRKSSRLIISSIYNACIRILFRTRIRDHMCGFKAFRRNVILSLVDELAYDTSLQRGIFWDTEMLVRARRHGYRIKEIPIWWTERNTSKLNFKREKKAVPYIVKFWIKMMRR